MKKISDGHLCYHGTAGTAQKIEKWTLKAHWQSVKETVALAMNDAF